MKKMLNNIRKNKKAGIGAGMNDFIAALIIVLLLICLIVLALVFHKNGINTNSQIVQLKIFEDKLNTLMDSLLREPQQDVVQFVDLIRNGDETAKKRLTDEVLPICNEIGQECDVQVFKTEIKCNKGLDAEKETFCYFIPGKDKITIRVHYYYLPEYYA